MVWAIFALSASLLFGAQSEMNKHFKIDGFALNTLSCFFAIFLLLPFIPMMEWPRELDYYLVALISASLGIVQMIAFYNLASNQNGRVACLYMPIAAIIIFITWLIIDQSQRDFLINNPYNLAAIVIAFTIFAASIQFIRRNDAGWKVLSAVIPIAILFSIGIIITKLFLKEYEHPFLVALNFVFLLNIFMFVLSLPILVSQTIKNKTSGITKQILKQSAMISFVHTASWVLFTTAIITAPNPAYVSVMDSLIPVWFLVYYKFRGYQDDANPKSGLLIALAAIILLIAAN